MQLFCIKLPIEPATGSFLRMHGNKKSPATFVTGDQSLYLFFPRSQRMIFDIDLDGIANRYLVCQDQLRG